MASLQDTTINGSLIVCGEIQPYIQIDGKEVNHVAKIQACDPEASDYFGYSVAISGDRIVVGAYGEDTTASSAGSAYIYDSNGSFISKIQACDPQSSDYFGKSVAISGDRIVVGAYGEDTTASSAGSVYIYDSNGSFISKIQACDPEACDYFGRAVAISGDRIVVGVYLEDTTASSAGSAYIYDSNGSFISKIQACDPEASDYFGVSVAISGDRIVVGAYLEDTTASAAGSAYIYDSNGSFICKFQACDPEYNDKFGGSVAISGDRIVVGAYLEDTTATDAGSAYVYDSNGSFISKIQACDPEASDYFGKSVAISGDRIVVGAYYEDTTADAAGSAYIYDSNGSFICKFQACDPEAYVYFGTAVDISGDRIVVGAYGEDTTATDAGGAYVYDLPNLNLNKFLTRITAPQFLS